MGWGQRGEAGLAGDGAEPSPLELGYGWMVATCPYNEFFGYPRAHEGQGVVGGVVPGVYGLGTEGGWQA